MKSISDETKESSSFLKKRTKKLLFLGYALSDRTATATKSLLLLFSRKEDFFCRVVLNEEHMIGVTSTMRASLDTSVNRFQSDVPK